MSLIKGKGAPTRSTKGAIGDIYVDLGTGKQYKCVNAYGVHGQFDYTWKLQNGSPVNVQEIKQESKKPESKVEKKVEPKEEPKVEPVVEAPVVEETEAKNEGEPVAPVETASKPRTNYAAAYNKKSK